MKIKPKPRQTKKQKAYLEWMGLGKPKKMGRLAQLTKFTRNHRIESEFVTTCKRLEPNWAPAT